MLPHITIHSHKELVWSYRTQHSVSQYLPHLWQMNFLYHVELVIRKTEKYQLNCTNSTCIFRSQNPLFEEFGESPLGSCAAQDQTGRHTQQTTQNTLSHSIQLHCL